MAFALDDLLLALLATAGLVGEAPERVFIGMVTTRVVCIGEDECL